MTIFTSMPLSPRILTFWFGLFLVKNLTTTAQLSTCDDICSIDDGLVLVNPSAGFFFPSEPIRTCEDVVVNGTNLPTIFCPVFERLATDLCCGPAIVSDLVETLVVGGGHDGGGGNFTALVAALQAANLFDALTGPMGFYTVFAPTDGAFEDLPEGLVDALLLPDNVDLLSEILLYHILPGEILSTDLADGMMLPTLESSSVIVSMSNETGTIMINEATIVTGDILASNGVIHVIDAVLVPESIFSVLPDFLANITNATDAF